MRKIAHIVNPIVAGYSSEHRVAQQVTFAAMESAKNYANGKVDVSILSAQYAEDRAAVPDCFQTTRDLDMSVLNLGTFQKRRKLPLIKNILDRMYEASDADYLIYTNVDIALMPFFYLTVNAIIDEGYDAFTINRRTISKKYVRVDQLSLMFSQVGETHPGHDCFIFKKSLYPKFNLGTTCIGANAVGRVLLVNLICRAERFKMFTDLHVTFHLGDDRNWDVPIYKDYDQHNEDELHKILLEYKEKKLFENKPLVENFLQRIEDSKFKLATNSSVSEHGLVTLLRQKLSKIKLT